MNNADESKNRVTIRDIASAAGVSHAAVSIVLNDKKDSPIRVSDDTRARILESANTLGYVPNQTARSLKGVRKSLIAVFTYEKVFPVDYRNEFYPFFAGIEQEAEQHGFDLLILNNRPNVSSFYDSTYSRIFSADAAIMIGIDRDDEGIKNLIRNGFPLIFVGRRELDGIETNFITFDYLRGIERVLRHLASKGCTSIHYVMTGGPQREPQQDRENCVRELYRDCGFTTLTLHKEKGTVLDLEELGIRNETDCLVFDHRKTAATSLGGLTPPMLPGGIPLAAAILEDNWAGDIGCWTRLESDRVLLGQATVHLLIEILNKQNTTPVHKLYPTDCIAGSSEERIPVHHPQ